MKPLADDRESHGFLNSPALTCCHGMISEDGLLMPSDSVIKLPPLRIRQRYRVGFQALPDRIQKFRLPRGREAIDLASQIAHTSITLAQFFRWCKHVACISGRMATTELLSMF